MAKQVQVKLLQCLEKEVQTSQQGFNIQIIPPTQRSSQPLQTAITHEDQFHQWKQKTD
jgi:hypothetical protein